MRIFWLNGALNLQGETEKELQALAVVYEGMRGPSETQSEPRTGANEAKITASKSD